MMHRMRFVLVPLYTMLLLDVKSPPVRSENPAGDKKTHHVMIHAISPEQAEAIQKIAFKHMDGGGSSLTKRIQEIRSSPSGSGNVFADVSDELLSELRAKGFAVVEDLYRESGKIVLDKNIQDIYLGPKTEARAGRPAMARYIRENPHENPEYRLWFLDAGVAKTSSIACAGTTLEVSKNARFVSILVGPSKEKSYGGSWDIYDCLGQKIGETNALWGSDEDPNTVAPSDAGNWIENAWFQDKRISFYSGGGKKRTDISFAGKEGVEPLLDLSSDGRFLIVQFMKVGKEVGGKNEVMLYDQNGQSVWDFIPEEQSNFDLITPSLYDDGTFVIASFCITNRLKRAQGTRGATYLLGKRGVVIRRIEDINPSLTEFSSTGKYVALLDRGGTGVLLETKSGTTLLKLSFPMLIDNVQIAESAGLLAGAGGPSIDILDFHGNKVWEIRHPLNTPQSYARISLSDNGDEISVASANRFFVYQRKR